MSPEAYARAVAELIAALILALLRVFDLVPGPRMTPTQWDGILRLAYPHVEQARTEAAQLAREMYDDQRSMNAPHLPRNDQPLVGSTYEDFKRALEPVRRRISQVDSVEKAVGLLQLEMARQVENAGRRQVIRAVESDERLALEQARFEPDPDPVPGPDPAEPASERPPEPVSGIMRGWARVATGRETCAWCLMLISRGPVYYAAETAGLNVSDETALRMIAAGEDVSDFMDDWHTGCDCKVVPVFKHQAWPGEKARFEALKLWKNASAEAAKLIASGKARTDNHNKEAINVIRRWIYHGEINPQDYAGLAA